MQINLLQHTLISKKEIEEVYGMLHGHSSEMYPDTLLAIVIKCHKVLVQWYLFLVWPTSYTASQQPTLPTTFVVSVLFNAFITKSWFSARHGDVEQRVGREYLCMLSPATPNIWVQKVNRADFNMKEACANKGSRLCGLYFNDCDYETSPSLLASLRIRGILNNKGK